MPLFPDGVPVLSDGTVTLRAHRPEDVPDLLEQARDPLMLRWTTVPDPSTPETARAFATQVVPSGWRDDTTWGFAVEAPGDDGRPRFAGSVELRDRGDRRAEIAYGAHPWARGRGYVHRALLLLLEWGFAEKHLHTVIWWANTGNWASRKTVWRLGFSFDGTVRRWLPQRGEMHDAWVGSLLATDPRRPRHPWFTLPVIHGDRVVLRGHREEDLAGIQEACSDERTQWWLPGLPSPYTMEDARRFVDTCREQLASAAGLTWVVADPATDELLGQVSLFDLKAGREAEVGYWSHPGVRGLGLVTEACSLVVRHAFVPEEDGGMGLQRLAVRAAEGNRASRRVAESTGFVETGRQRNGSVVRDGSLTDTICYDLLVSEYAVPG